MITLIQSMPAGNAVRLFVSPPAGATETRVLRKTANSFTGPNDSGALVVADEEDMHAAMDVNNVINGTQYWYQDYSKVSGSWVAGTAISVTPQALYEEGGTAVLSTIRERIVLGMAVEQSRGTFTHRNGSMPVLLDTPTYEDADWPMITLTMSDDTPHQFFIGGGETEQYDSANNLWDVSDGYLADAKVAIVVWAMNADLRRTIRKALSRVLTANLQVFDELGLYEVSFSRQDVDDMTSYPAPVYQSMFTLSCVADKSVVSAYAPISSVDLTVTASD